MLFSNMQICVHIVSQVRDLTWRLIFKNHCFKICMQYLTLSSGDTSWLLSGPLKLCSVKQEWTCKCVEAICMQKVLTEMFCLINVKQLHFKIKSLKMGFFREYLYLSGYIPSYHCLFLHRYEQFSCRRCSSQMERYHFLFIQHRKRPGNQGPCWAWCSNNLDFGNVL